MLGATTLGAALLLVWFCQAGMRPVTHESTNTEKVHGMSLRAEHRSHATMTIITPVLA